MDVPKNQSGGAARSVRSTMSRTALLSVAAVTLRACYLNRVPRARRIRLWTPDFGTVEVAADDSERVRYFLQEILDLGLWEQFRKFPVDVVRSNLTKLVLPSYRRRLIEIWIEENSVRPAA